MQRQTKQRFTAGAAVVLAAIVIVGAACYARPRVQAQEGTASNGTGSNRTASTAPASAQDKPSLSYWHVWTDDKGVSHQKQCELTAFELQSISPGASPSWLDRQSTPGATVVMVVQPVGWVGEWHENPKPQWIVPLSGRWFVETMDGKRVEMGPGEISFGGDQNCKRDAQGRKGHRSGTVGNQPTINLIVQLENDPSAGRPCGFK